MALEQGWNQDEALDSLIRKSGFRDKITKDVKKIIQLERYQSQTVTMTYQEYLNAK